MSVPLVFLDTETDSLAPGRRAWEIAMIRSEPSGEQRETTMFVGIDMRHSDPQALAIGRFFDRHPAGRKVSGKDPCPTDTAPVLSKHDAAREVMRWTFGAHIVAANPAFDTHHLAGLLRSEGYLPSWDYHLIDVTVMALGWLRARTRADAIVVDQERVSLRPPHSTSALSLALGVDAPTPSERHTALGDARWVMRMWDAMTRGDGS